jgi:branched-chain amino acid transport system permease protein
LVLGLIYAVIALGFYITWMCHKSVNFAQGDLLMVGAFVGFVLYVNVGLPFIAVVLIVIAIQALLGWVVEFVAVRPATRVLTMGWLMSTLGIGMILRNVAVRIWAGIPRNFPSPVGEGHIMLGKISILPQELFILGVTIVVMVCLFLFLKRTTTGKALEAVAFDRDTASLMGINPTFAVSLSYMIATVLAGIGGIMVAPITFVSHDMGLKLLIASFIGALLGCLESPLGIVVGSLMIGLIGSWVSMWNSNAGSVAGTLLLIAVLAIKPIGLLGKTED